MFIDYLIPSAPKPRFIRAPCSATLVDDKYAARRGRNSQSAAESSHHATANLHNMPCCCCHVSSCRHMLDAFVRRTAFGSLQRHLLKLTPCVVVRSAARICREARGMLMCRSQPRVSEISYNEHRHSALLDSENPI